MSGLKETHITIVGAGRVGQNFAKSAPHHSLIRRGDSLSDLPKGPIVLCTRNDDLEGIVDSIQKERHCDLIFVQNGMIEHFLGSRDLLDTTQALLYIAIGKIGDQAVDGEKTVVVGKWSELFCDLMSVCGLKCQSVDRKNYRVQMAEKFLWIASFGVLCDVHGKSVGDVAQEHRSDVDALSEELRGVVARNAGIQIPTGLCQRLCLYSESIPNYRASVKEWSWRNGWLWEREQSPLHASFLNILGRA
ncbi:MAG: hypothetical protein CMK59_09935 [Proteobacteria bacterium]|nr:hypothetical protein [Pseudomonadota bacterium]